MRPTKAIVRLSAIRKNLQTAAGLAPGSGNIAVIKANAYGHGAVEVANALLSEVPAFAVAIFDEAVQLRDAGIKKPILVLQGTTQPGDVAEAAARDFWLMLHNRQQVERVLKSDTRKPVRAWVKADTGMHRLGLMPQELDSAVDALFASENVHPGLVLCSHLACADDLSSPMAKRQVDRLRRIAKQRGMPLSIANSAAIMSWPESHADWNRPGYMLYGNCPLGSIESDAGGLKPAMSMNSEIIALRTLEPGEGVGYGLNWVAERPSVIGTVSIGYGDGYPRHAPGGTPVLVNGQRVPLAGRVSMDMITVDLTDLENAQVGDPVELWGENLGVNEVAACAGTIGYELLAGLTGRVPLIYR